MIASLALMMTSNINPSQTTVRGWLTVVKQSLSGMRETSKNKKQMEQKMLIDERKKQLLIDTIVLKAAQNNLKIDMDSLNTWEELPEALNNVWYGCEEPLSVDDIYEVMKANHIIS